jgi:hypothetical protein
VHPVADNHYLSSQLEKIGTLLVSTASSIIENRYTRDAKVGLEDGAWGSFATRPPGDGWVVFDTLSRDRRTCWQRFRLIDGGST